MKTFTIKIGKGPDEMTFDECMAHIKRVLFWDYIDGEWCDVEILNDMRWEELAGYIIGAHEREVDALKTENAKLRELLVDAVEVADDYYYCGGVKDDLDAIKEEMRVLGIEESYERE